MTPSPGYADSWQRAIRVHLDYYQRLTELALEYWADMGRAFTGGELRAERATGAAAAAVADDAPLVLEGTAGATAVGAFVVHNGLERHVSAPVVVSVPRTDAGAAADAAITCVPDPVVLEPGERVLVRVMARVPETCLEGVEYRGQIGVPEVSEGRVAIILRRLQA